MIVNIFQHSMLELFLQLIPWEKLWMLVLRSVKLSLSLCYCWSSWPMLRVHKVYGLREKRCILIRYARKLSQYSSMQFSEMDALVVKLDSRKQHSFFSHVFLLWLRSRCEGNMHRANEFIHHPLLSKVLDNQTAQYYTMHTSSTHQSNSFCPEIWCCYYYYNPWLTRLCKL